MPLVGGGVTNWCGGPTPTLQLAVGLSLSCLALLASHCFGLQTVSFNLPTNVVQNGHAQ